MPNLLCRLFRLPVAAIFWLSLGATSPAPPPIDTAMVERAVTGAEWLAARIEESPGRRQNATLEPHLTGWLLVAAGITGRDRYQRFSQFLVVTGYPVPDLAVQMWTHEFRRVLVADRSARLGANRRLISDIEAEIKSLPTVPLDETDEAERDALMEELSHAAVPEGERKAVAIAATRIDAILALRDMEEKE